MSLYSLTSMASMGSMGSTVADATVPLIAATMVQQIAAGLTPPEVQLASSGALPAPGLPAAEAKR